MKNARISLVEEEKKPAAMKETADIKEHEWQFLPENKPDPLPGDQINPDAAREMGVSGSAEETGRWSLDQLLLDHDSREACAGLPAPMGDLREAARLPAQRLYRVSERKGRVQDGPTDNRLAVAWPGLKVLAARQDRKQDQLL